MATEWGVGDYRYEFVAGWPDYEIEGVSADVAGDSQGNIYTTETYEGKRLQKFVFQGLGTGVAADQGVVWPN